MRLICPHCRKELEPSPALWRCPGCAAVYPEKDGVVLLSDAPSYWSLLPQEKLAAWLQSVRQLGWKKAIQTSPDKAIRAMYEFTAAPARADGTFYLKLNSAGDVLDLGPGWGSYSFALAPRVNSVTAADTNLEALNFIRLRADQAGQKNLRTVKIAPLDSGRVPFVTGSFDAVIMNGVLEWVGAYAESGDPLRLQTDCLREVCRVLKPGGELWLGIENRFGARYWRGAPDDHLNYYDPAQKIAYTTLMPRWLASLVARRRLGRPYRTYTHSYGGLRRLLKRAGFREVEFYCPDPDYRAPAAKIIPAASRELGWNKYFSDSYFVIARRGK